MAGPVGQEVQIEMEFLSVVQEVLASFVRVILVEGVLLGLRRAASVCEIDSL